MCTVEERALEKLEKEYLEKKKRLEDRIKRRAHLNPDELALAEKLHQKLCHANHTDGCDWYYDNGSWAEYSRKEYLHKARLMLNIVDKETAMKLMEIY